MMKIQKATIRFFEDDKDNHGNQIVAMDRLLKSLRGSLVSVRCHMENLQ